MTFSFDQLMKYSAYKKATPKPLGPVEWFKKFYPEAITYQCRKCDAKATEHINFHNRDTLHYCEACVRPCAKAEFENSHSETVQDIDGVWWYLKPDGGCGRWVRDLNVAHQGMRP
jgi:hypothetical protein